MRESIAWVVTLVVVSCSNQHDGGMSLGTRAEDAGGAPVDHEVKDFLRRQSDSWETDFESLPLERAIDVAMAAQRREPPSEQFQSWAYRRFGADLVAPLLRRLDAARDNDSVFILMMFLANDLKHTGRQLSKDEFLRCEAASKRLKGDLAQTKVKELLSELRPR